MTKEIECPNCGGDGWYQVWSMSGYTEQERCDCCDGIGVINCEK